jgi:hypothetical protein
MPITFFGSTSVPADNGANRGDLTITLTPPASMVAGDLCIIRCTLGTTGGTASITSAGGQTWTSETAITVNGNYTRVFWCRFNGTWSGSLILTPVNSNNTHNWTAVMGVFRPSNGANTWAVDGTTSYEVNGVAGTTATFSGMTTTHDNAIVIAIFQTQQALTYSSTSGTGWSLLGDEQFRNTGGGDTTLAFAQKLMPTAGATGSVTKTTSVNDFHYAAGMSFYEISSLTHYTLTAEQGSFALSGQAAGLTAQRKITADQASISLAGSPAALSYSAVQGVGVWAIGTTFVVGGVEHQHYTLTAVVGTFAQSNPDTGLIAARKLTADQASFALSGQANSLLHGFSIPAEAAAFSLTVFDNALVAGRKIEGVQQSFALTGQDIGFKADRKLTMDPGSFSFTGFDIGVSVGRLLEFGSFSLSTFDAGFSVTRIIPGEAASFVLSGQDASILKASVMSASVAVFPYDVYTASLIAGRKIAADLGSMALTASNTNLTYTEAGHFFLLGETRFLTLTGRDATLKATRKMVADPMQVLLTGFDLQKVYNRRIVAEARSYVLTGVDQRILWNRLLSPVMSNYVLSGKDILFGYEHLIVPETIELITMLRTTIDLETPLKNIILTTSRL